MSPKNTGVARTMTWLGDSSMRPFWRRSGQRASRVNPDDLVHAALVQAAGDADQVVVQVDRRVAVAGDEPDHLVQVRHALVAARGLQDAVLVAAVQVIQF